MINSIPEQSPHDEEISLLDTIGELDAEADDADQRLYHDDNYDNVVNAEESTIRRYAPAQRIQQSPSSHRKKKIKNRHVKAAIMIAAIWTIMVTFLIVSLSVDWWNRAWKDISDVCILCGSNGIDGLEEIPITEWPTRRPSSTQGTSSLFEMLGKHKTLLPPPKNIGQVCSPSIYLDHGYDYVGSSINDLLAGCANACFPAICCIVNDEEAKLGLVHILQEQGLGSQASIYLSSVENCYVDNNIATCDEYGEWCQVLYKLQSVLKETVTREIETNCASGSKNTTISPRMFESDVQECSVCDPLICCYESERGSSTTIEIQRKRKRQHGSLFDAVSKDGAGSRYLLSDGTCGSFIINEGSLNANLCDVYGPYCNPSHKYQSAISIPSLTRPTILMTDSTLQPTSTYNTSYHPTISLPSYYPTISPELSDRNEESKSPVPTFTNHSHYPTAPTYQSINQSLTSSNESYIPSQTPNFISHFPSDVPGMLTGAPTNSSQKPTIGQTTSENSSYNPTNSPVLYQIEKPSLEPSDEVTKSSQTPSLSQIPTNSPIMNENPSTGNEPLSTYIPTHNSSDLNQTNDQSSKE